MEKAKRLPSGKWRTKLYLGKDREGKKKYKSFTANTKKESEQKVIDYLKEHKIKNAEEIYNGYITDAVKDYIDLKSDSLSPNTIRGYKTIYRNQIQLLKDIRVSDFTTQDHQKWIDKISKDLKAKSVKNIDGLLVSSLKHYNIILKPIVLPQKEYSKMYIPTTEDIKKIIEYFTNRNNKEMIKAVYLAATGTLRRGEVCALQGEDVDFENNTIFIHKSVAIDDDGFYIVKEPKTYSSNRIIEMPKFIIEMLPKEGNVVKLSLRQVSRQFAKCVKDLEMEHYTFHSLRHYSASIMHSNNIPTQYIMERGGWKSESTLNRIYRNSLDDYKKKFNHQTNQFFENSFSSFNF